MARASTADVEKYCDCGPAKWTKCPDAWYGKKFRYKGREYAPNVTRYALDVLGKTIETKGQAIEIWEAIRTAIRNGTYVSAKAYTPPAAAATRAADGPTTLLAIAEAFKTSVIDADVEKKPNSKTNDKAAIARLVGHVGAGGRRLGDRDMATITIDDLVHFRAAQRGPNGELARSTWNKIRTVLGQLWSWAAWRGYIGADLFQTTPKDQLRRLARKKAAKRTRRIDDAEWANLREAARETRTSPAARRLGAILVALWETGARVGELLALQWRDVNRGAGTIYLRGEEIGSGKTGARMIEISAPLDAILETLGVDPAGAALPKTAYVFGDEYGGRIQSIDKAWRTTVLRANAIEPAWTPAGDFDAASRAALKRIGLHLHDVRHEAACRWLESGLWSLGEISERLGHSSIEQTATYLHVRKGSTRNAQAAYDKARQAAAAAETGTKAAAIGGKVGENGRSREKAARGPRLVKGNKANRIK